MAGYTTLMMLPFIIAIIVTVAALISIASNPVANASKPVWVLITLFVPFGWLLWFAVGKARTAPATSPIAEEVR